ncbi:MAG: hypothetical protein KF883_13880 [Thermomicrobiales bacterium]|nr:hypothetical protein [Thermomicrobiales bacterium]
MEKTTLYLPTSLKSEIRILAQQSQRSEAEMIEEALITFVEQSRPTRPLPKSLGMASDGTIDAAEYEAWLDEHWKPDW